MAEVEMTKPGDSSVKRDPKITVHDDELELTEDEPKTVLERCWYAFSKAGEAAGFDVPDIKTLEVDNTVVDTADLPKSWSLNSFVFYQLCFWALAAFFFARNYLLCRTSTFISLDSGAGVCKGDGKSDSCCEVPVTISGEFLADTGGRWNTFPKFNYNFNNYVLELTGVSYTNEEYINLMKKISREVKAIGSRGKNRDYSWNMVAWSSFTSLNTDSGYFKFMLSGDVGIIFAKSLVGIGFASNQSSCHVPISANVNSATREIDVTVNLQCDSPPCKANPCPGTLSPQAFGYDTEYASTADMTFTLDLASINTALAVNMGIIPLSNLVSYYADNSRVSLLQAMHKAGSIDSNILYNTSSYYEPLYAPMTPIYCTSFNGFNTSSCFVRIGNTLAYPVVNHYGWSSDGYGRPSRCTKAAASAAGSAANYYCNKLDLVTGLIYYPIANVNITDLIKHSTWSPTRQPSQNPTPLPGQPTIRPTTTRPSATPTLKPSREPTYTRTRKPSKAPSAAPTLKPTAPTETPTTASPTFRTRRPSVQEENTAVLRQENVEVEEAIDIESTTGNSTAGGQDDFFYYDDTPSGYFYGSSSPNYGYFPGSFSSSPGSYGYSSGALASSSSSSVSLSSGEGFVPLVPQIVDNGLIFTLGKMVAKKVSQSLQNDDYLSKASYDAMISTILGSSKHSFLNDFKKICNGNGTAAGCAMFAFEVYGGDNRVVNKYSFQPSTTPAFSDSIYVARTMNVISKRAPTSLVETYYSCVLGIWDSIFQAIGLANSSVQFFVTVGFFIYFYTVVTYLNNIQNKEIEMLRQKKRRLARESKMREKQLDRVATVFGVMKTRFDALCDDVKSGDKNFSGFERAVLQTEEENEAANVAILENEGLSTPKAEGDGYNQVTTTDGENPV